MATETITTQMSASYSINVVRDALPKYLNSGSNALSSVGVSFQSMGPLTPTSVTAYLRAQGENVTAEFQLVSVPGGTKIIGKYTVPKMNWLERKIVNGIFSAKQGEIERDFSNFLRDLQASGPDQELAG